MGGRKAPATTNGSHDVMTNTQDFSAYPTARGCLAQSEIDRKYPTSVPSSDPLREIGPLILERRRSNKWTRFEVCSLRSVLVRQDLIKIGLICLTLLAVTEVIAQGDMTQDSMRCGTQLVNIGDTQDEILKKCGKPYALRDMFNPNAPQQIVGDQPVDYRPNIQWVYHPGYGQFDNVLVFEGGQLSQIKVQNSGD